jgi:hypothetical protein
MQFKSTGQLGLAAELNACAHRRNNQQCRSRYLALSDQLLFWPRWAFCLMVERGQTVVDASLPSVRDLMTRIIKFTGQS